jgi:hypothetical protein|tara:strand:- start:45 stop:581 length:537 start_codon:yes stop_codon:yes gene_type:complete
MNKLTYGASVFDFDETVGFSDNVVTATKDGYTISITSYDWPKVGEKMISDGWVMDFDDFNKITNGKPGPLIDKLKNQIHKYGYDSVYILTARHSDSEQAIYEWLLEQNIELKRENIVGLGSSTGESKANWIQDNLITNGVNDIYFVDDAFSNVKAVKDMFKEYPKGFLVEGGKSIITI